MQVPAEVRAGMLASYQSREGVLQALHVLVGSVLDDTQREQVIQDTLRGHAEAKRSWPEQGMIADVSAALAGLDLTVEIILAERDPIEREAALRPIFAECLPQATLTIIPDVGHLVPLEAPHAVASACERAFASMS